MNTQPCRCDAYRFPHRAGSGQCAGDAPACSDCHYGRQERDPLGTGDKRYVEIECTAPACPWGK